MPVAGFLPQRSVESGHEGAYAVGKRSPLSCPTAETPKLSGASVFGRTERMKDHEVTEPRPIGTGGEGRGDV